MRKKFYNGMLIVAMLFATMSSYVSCKDYDEDAYAELKGENSTLNELIRSQIDALNGQIDDLKKAQEECKNNCLIFKQQIELWQKYVEENYVTVDEYNEHIKKYTEFIAENQAQHDALEKKINELRDELLKANEALKAEMESKLLKVQQDLTALITSIQTKYDQLEGSITNNTSEIENAIKENKEELKKAIEEKNAELEKAINNNISDLEERVAANEAAISNLQKSLDKLESYVYDKIRPLLNKTVEDVVRVQALAEQDSIRIDALEKAYEEQGLKIDSICNEINTIKDSVNYAIQLANENLQAAKDYTDDRIDEVNGKIDGINTKISDLETAYKAADEKLQEQIDSLQKKHDDLVKRVEKNEKDIEELFSLYNKVDESLKQFITGIILQRTENPVFGSFSFPANIQTNVLMAYYGNAGEYGIEFPSFYPRYYVRESETLTEKDIEMLGVKPYTAKDGEALTSGAGKVYVTVNPSNVNFEGQTLPIVNSIEEESGIKLSPLKYSDKKLTFGATRAAANGFYEAEATLAAEDIEKVKMTFDLNVGELKETVKDVINPLDGVNVTRVVNTVADIVGQFNQNLDANALKASWTDSLGVSRSIYSQYNLATTAISPLSYAFAKDVNFTSFPGVDRMQNLVGRVFDAMGNRIQMVLDNIDFSFNLDIEKIEGIKFDSININTDDINLDLTVTYKDTIPVKVPVTVEKLIEIKIDTTVNVEERPISLEIPVKGEVKDALGNVIGSFDHMIDTTVLVPAQDIDFCIEKNIDFIWSDTITTDVVIDIEIPVDMSEFQKMINEIEGMEDDINGMLSGQQDNINNIINTINSYLDELGSLTDLTDKFANIGSDVDSALDNIKDKIVSFLDKAENKLVAAVNSVNKTLQPVMLVRTTDGFQKVSQTIYNPTWMSAGDVQFVATSYTAEVIAPAYKKLVGVTNVYSMDRSQNAQTDGGEYLTVLREANAKAGVAEILDGDTQIVNFSAKKNYIYEVTYTSVDFSGMVVAKKFYVTVK